MEDIEDKILVALQELERWQNRKIKVKERLERNDADIMAESIIKIIQNPELGNKLSYNARNKVEAQYSREVVIQRWQSVFHDYL